MEFLTKFWRTIALPLGLSTGIAIGFIIAKSPDLETSDGIDLAAIVVNIILGVAIVWIIQKKLSDDRGVKDYLISEVIEIKEDYKAFMAQMWKGEVSSKHTIEWFKHISMKIGHLEYFLKWKLSVNNSSVSVISRNIQKLVTDSRVFNNNFKKNGFILPPAEKSKVFEEFKNLKFELIDVIILVNKA